MGYHLPRFIPCRYIYMLLGFLGMLFTFAMMTNLAIAMVSMVNHTAIKILHEDDFRSIRGIVHFHLDTIPDDEILPEESPEDGTNIWSLSLQGIIISSYFWGYLLGQLPGARLSEDVSGAWTFFAGVSIHILGTLLIPEAGHIHYGLIIAIRVVQGFMGGFTFPATHFLLTRWAPPHERSLISSFVYSGGPMGNVISLIFTGSICYYINWEASFYILGGISAPWMILWAILVNDNPRKHKFIREEEREYLTTTLQLTDDKMSHSRVPWKSIARSGQVWILILTHSALCWGFYVNLTQLPLYMKMVLHFSLCYGRLADYLISTGKLPLTTVRRLSTVIAATVPALCCIAVPFTTSHVIAVCLMITGNTFFAAVFSGFQQAHMDIASRFAATLMSLTNSCGTVSGIIVPIFSGWMLDKDISMRSWQVIFFVTAGFYLSAAIIFGLFAKSDELPWNKDSYKEDE
ncbi:Major Facilitator Superfamily [Popillia japonica]|uniref:Major Facilitator Superfamily n=1 Tax=Popillia japonica TaxID=7064 RepID=A0AAW1KJA2_POPJA